MSLANADFIKAILRSGEVHKRKNAEPQESHEVPVPPGGVNGDLLRLESAPEPASQQGIDQNSHPPDKMDGVEPGERIKEGPAGIGPQIHTLMAQIVPDQ